MISTFRLRPSFISGVFILFFILCNDGAFAAPPTGVTVRSTGAKTVGSLTIYSSTELEVAWISPQGTSPDHYLVTATEGIGNTSLSYRASSQNITLSGLKSATTYSVVVKACGDAACTTSESSSPVQGATNPEYWLLQGSGNTTSGLTRIVSDGNARLSATRIGPDAGDASASRIQLYYGPLLSAGETSKLTTAITSEATNAGIPTSYLIFQSYASSSGLFSPTASSPLVKAVATGQGVPLSSSMGAKIRLFFEAQGSDSKTRILYLDSVDGYIGRDFNTGSSGICSLSSDYQTGGGCAPQVAIGVAGDTVNPNAAITNARQFKLGYPTLDDWRWDGAAGTFMVFTTDQVSGCSTANMNHGYAVWDGSKWKVQYEQGGCPKLFKNAQAAFPMHIGGKKFKMYYGDPSITTGKLNTNLPFLGPKKLIYADAASSGISNYVDFEDWENQQSARNVIFLWPNGDKLDDRAEGYIDDYHFMCPTGTLDLQVMYITITNGTEVPFTSAAVLLNPGNITVESPPSPVISANGSTGTLTVDRNTPVSVTVQIDEGTMSGRSADWWVVRASPSGYSSYVAGTGWVEGIALTYQGPMFGIPNPIELQKTNLEPADYTYYFGVDLTPNGIVDLASLYYSFVGIRVTNTNSGSSRTLSLTRGSPVKLVDSAIFPGIVHDGTQLYMSYGKANDLYIQTYDTGFNSLSQPKRVTSRGDVTDHKHIFFQNHHYLLYSTIGDRDLYQIKLDTNLNQVGNTITVASNSTNTKTNDMLLGTDGSRILTGQFRPSDLNRNENSGHLIKIHDSNLNYIAPDIVVNVHPHINTASLLKVGDRLYIIAPSLPISGRQVQTQLDLHLLRFDTSWVAVDSTVIRLVDSMQLVHNVNGDGLWMSTGIAYDSETNRLILGHTFRDGTSGSDSGKLYLRVFDGNTFAETYSEIMVDSLKANRAHFLLLNDTLFVVYDESSSGTPSIFGLQYRVSRN